MSGSTGTKISALPTLVYTPQLLLPAVDLTKVVGLRNGVLTTDALFTAFKAASGQGFEPVVTTPEGGVSVPANGTVDTLMFQPTSTLTDVLVYNLKILGVTIAAPVYNFQIWAGVPSGANPTLLYDYNVSTNTLVGADGNDTLVVASTIYAPAAAGSNLIYLRIINTQIIPMTVNVQMVAMEFMGDGALLTGYVTPPVYSGPLMNTVLVGPNEQFIEPRFGLAACADGATMRIDSGIYYLPIGIANGHTTPNYAVNPNFPRTWEAGLTMTGQGTYNAAPTILNGRGGAGIISGHPFTLTSGKGMIYTEMPLNASGILFQACGGADNFSDGEAGIYAQQHDGANPVPTQINVTSCAFDNNEDGLFIPEYGSQGNFGADINITLQSCDFGYALPNGAGGDGLSSDNYLNCVDVIILGSNYYGDLSPLPQKPTLPNGNVSTSGNCIKARSLNLTVTGCWVRNQSGKLIDRPDGGSEIVTNCVFSSLGGATELMFGYNTEGLSPIPQSNPTFVGCTLYISRNDSIGWVNNAPDIMFDWSDTSNVFKFTNSAAYFIFNRDNSQLDNDPTAVSANFPTGPTQPPGTVFVNNPPAPPPASCPTGAVVAPLNP
jgi:hypothetical protein